MTNNSIPNTPSEVNGFRRRPCGSVYLAAVRARLEMVENQLWHLEGHLAREARAITLREVDEVATLAAADADDVLAVRPYDPTRRGIPGMRYEATVGANT